MANNKKTCFTAPLGLEKRGNGDHERFKHMTVEKLQDLLHYKKHGRCRFEKKTFLKAKTKPVKIRPANKNDPKKMYFNTLEWGFFAISQ